MEELKNMKKRSVSDLKDLCRQKSLPVGGNKDALIKRLLGEGGPSKKARTDDNKENAPPTMETFAEWCTLKSGDLKLLVKERGGLPVTGTIPQYLARLYTGKKHPKDEEEDIARGLGGKNEYLVKQFEKIAEEEEGFKQISARRLVTLFKYYPYKITSGKQAGKLKGVGKSTVSKIDKWLEEEANPQEEKEEPAVQEAEELPTSGLHAQLEAILREDDTEDGYTVSELVAKVPGGTEEAEVAAWMADMMDEGRVYTTVNEDTFKLA